MSRLLPVLIAIALVAAFGAGLATGRDTAPRKQITQYVATMCQNSQDEAAFARCLASFGERK